MPHTHRAGKGGEGPEVLGWLWPAMRVVSRSKTPVGCRLRPVSELGGARAHLDLPHTKPGSDPTLVPLKPPLVWGMWNVQLAHRVLKKERNDASKAAQNSLDSIGDSLCVRKPLLLLQGWDRFCCQAQAAQLKPCRDSRHTEQGALPIPTIRGDPV